MESLSQSFSGLSPGSTRRIAAGHDDMPNGKTGSNFSAEEKVDSAAACEVIYNTMKAQKFDPPASYDHPLLPDSDAYWDSLGLDGPTKRRILKFAKAAVSMGDLTYPFLPRDNRIAVGIYSTWLMWFDDDAPTEELKVFRQYCTSDRSKLSATMRHFADFVDHFASYYGPIAGDLIWSATFQFLNACIVEYIHGKGIAVPRSAVLFPDFQRSKSGVADPFCWAAFCQADFPEDEWLMREMFVLPDMIEVLNCANDVMSFYKEHVIGEEQFTYVWNYSCCHDMSLLEGLKNTASRTLNAVERIRTTLAGQPELRRRIEELALGYMYWHWFFETRYHLQDLFKLDIAPRSN